MYNSIIKKISIIRSTALISVYNAYHFSNDAYLFSERFIN